MPLPDTERPVNKHTRPAKILYSYACVIAYLFAVTVIACYCSRLMLVTMHQANRARVGSAGVQARDLPGLGSSCHSNVHGAAPAQQPAPVLDPWLGHPAPAPGSYLRETADYSDWRRAFCAALPRLERKGRHEDVAALRQWYHRFVAAQARGESGSKLPALPPAFHLRVVQRSISPPPTACVTQFAGYKVVLPWNGDTYYYRTDNIPLKSPYLLHSNGVKDSGTPVRSRDDIHQLFAIAGVADPVAKDVLIKVSQVEGGFDAVNTWDTGYVSIGFLQFTTGETGTGHSLLRVLARMKSDEEARCAQEDTGHRDEFARYFSEHGIDVRDDILYVRDPCTGNTVSGADAVSLLIQDKRLIAMFQDAGIHSRAFQLAQIHEAYHDYYLADSPVSIPVAEIRSYEPCAQSGAPREQASTTPDAKHTVVAATPESASQPAVSESAPQPAETAAEQQGTEPSPEDTQGKKPAPDPKSTRNRHQRRGRHQRCRN